MEVFDLPQKNCTQTLQLCSKLLMVKFARYLPATIAFLSISAEFRLHKRTSASSRRDTASHRLARSKMSFSLSSRVVTLVLSSPPEMEYSGRWRCSATLSICKVSVHSQYAYGGCNKPAVSVFPNPGFLLEFISSVLIAETTRENSPVKKKDQTLAFPRHDIVKGDGFILVSSD